MDTLILHPIPPARKLTGNAFEALYCDARAAAAVTETALEDILPASERAVLETRLDVLHGFLCLSQFECNAAARERVSAAIHAALVEDAPEPLDGVAPPTDPKNPVGSEPIFRGLSGGVLTFDVPSFTDPHGPVYRVTVHAVSAAGLNGVDGTCTCPARKPCKHIRACGLLVPVYPGPHAPAAMLSVPLLSSQEQAAFEAAQSGPAHGPLCGCGSVPAQTFAEQAQAFKDAGQGWDGAAWCPLCGSNNCRREGACEVCQCQARLEDPPSAPEPPNEALPVPAPQSAPRPVPAPRLSAIHDLLQVAGSKLQYPALHLLTAAGLEIELSPGKGDHVGCVWVSGPATVPGDWFSRPRYGRIGQGERFQPGRDYAPGIREALLEFVSDPQRIIRQYGQRTGNCCFCLKPLTDPTSTACGFGKTCAKNWGLKWEVPGAEVA